MLELGRHAEAEALLTTGLHEGRTELVCPLVLPEAFATIGLARAAAAADSTATATQRAGSKGGGKAPAAATAPPSLPAGASAEDAFMASLGFAAQLGDPHSEMRALAVLTAHYRSMGETPRADLQEALHRRETALSSTASTARSSPAFRLLFES